MCLFWLPGRLVGCGVLTCTVCCAGVQVTRERIRQIEAKAIRELRAHHISPGSVLSDYQLGPMADKQLASRTSSGTKKQK